MHRPPDGQLSEEAHRIERSFTKIDSHIRAHGLGVSEL